jgi:hypothetical protein
VVSVLDSLPVNCCSTVRWYISKLQWQGICCACMDLTVWLSGGAFAYDEEAGMAAGARHWLLTPDMCLLCVACVKMRTVLDGSALARSAAAAHW